MRIGAILVAIAALNACATPPQAPETQDISFARGCWIDRMPSGETRTIRVLPARNDSTDMQLDLMIYGARPEAEPPEDISYTISPDGATISAYISWTDAPHVAVAHPGWSTIAAGWKAAFWKSADGKLMIKLTGNGDDRMVFQQARFGGSEMVISEFNGQRDGCD